MAAHSAASTGRRLGAWVPNNLSPAGIAIQSGDLLVRRSRQTARENPHAGSAVDSLVSNLVGSGIKPLPLTDDQDTKRQILARWNEWIKFADVGDTCSFYGLQALAVRAMIEGGECFIRRRYLKDGSYKLQLIEAEQVPFEENHILVNGNEIIAGVEVDPLGVRVAYHMYTRHPGDGMCPPLTRVLAEDVYHVYHVKRPSQIRGEPWLAKVLVKLYELDQYDDAELVRKKIAAMMALIVTQPQGLSVGGEDDEEADERGVVEGVWEPGGVLRFLPGMNVQVTEPADLGGQYEVFMRQQLRAIAVGAGLTYEQITGDLTQVNFSSIRAGWIEVRRKFEQIQQMTVIHQLCRKVWADWMDNEILNGGLQIIGYAKNKIEHRSVKWIPQGWKWVDPVKDVSSMVMAIRAGIMTKAEAASIYGSDSEEIDREMAKEFDRADSLGLVYDSDPRNRTKTGAKVEKNGQ